MPPPPSKLTRDITDDAQIPLHGAERNATSPDYPTRSNDKPSITHHEHDVLRARTNNPNPPTPTIPPAITAPAKPCNPRQPCTPKIAAPTGAPTRNATPVTTQLMPSRVPSMSREGQHVAGKMAGGSEMRPPVVKPYRAVKAAKLAYECTASQARQRMALLAALRNHATIAAVGVVARWMSRAARMRPAVDVPADKARRFAEVCVERWRTCSAYVGMKKRGMRYERNIRKDVAVKRRKFGSRSAVGSRRAPRRWWWVDPFIDRVGCGWGVEVGLKERNRRGGTARRNVPSMMKPRMRMVVPKLWMVMRWLKARV